ncbi:MAG TPA: hypothetical protein VGR37_08750 [Longimicrobiaceae bacterium]|nr:hypothetical protein [Longimicrobiaceae bacterium]
MSKRNWALLAGAVVWTVVAYRMEWPPSSGGPLVRPESRWVIPALAGWAFCFLFWGRRTT